MDSRRTAGLEEKTCTQEDYYTTLLAAYHTAVEELGAEWHRDVVNSFAETLLWFHSFF